MASKRKAEEPVAAEPVTKTAKDTEAKEAVKEEEDAKKDARPQISAAVGFETSETTLNVQPVLDGHMLMSMTDGGMQFLIGGARANVGVKSGRYFYEVKVVEALSPAESKGKSGPAPKQLVRVGFSTAGSSLILGDGSDGVCFESTGNLLVDKDSNGKVNKKQVCPQFGKDAVVGVLLNLDSKSPNFNTVSLFVKGVRVCEPQALPEHLKGKVLLPHIAYRNVSLQVNFGNEPLAALPFKCRMLQEAADADVKVTKSSPPKGGKYDVVFPVGFPNEGTFDWLDGFLAKNPNFVELSDRMIHDWCAKSGLWKSKAAGESRDKPTFNYGVSGVDDGSIRRAIMSAAPLVPRHYVVMEVKQNLVEADRKVNLQRFCLPHFRKIAHVAMGDPVDEFKAKVHASLLEEKQAKAEREWKVKKENKARKKLLEEKQKKAKEEAKKRAEESAKRKAEAEAKRKELVAKRKAELEAKKAAALAEKEGGAEKKDDAAAGAEEKKEADAAAAKAEEEKKEAEVKEAAAKEEEKKEAEAKAKEEAEAKAKEEETKEDEDMDDAEPPKVALDDNEKKIVFKPSAQKDLSDAVMSKSFASFSVPEKSEGFDEIKFEWQPASKSKEYLKTWVSEQKIKTRIDDLQPSEWFKLTLAEFERVSKEFETKQKDYAKKHPKVIKKKADEDEEEETQVDVDLFSVKDVCDIDGKGEPLFKDFSFEDWALCGLRFELHLLMAAFKKDVDDPERLGIHESHVLFYFTKYFKKQLNFKAYGKESVADLFELLKDVVGIDAKQGVLEAKLPEGSPTTAADFVKLQEENRRERQRRIDAGDETVRLNFTALKKAIADKEKAAKDAVEKAEKRKKDQEEWEKQKVENAAKAEKAKLEAAEAAKKKAATATTAGTPAPKAATAAPKAAANAKSGAPEPVKWNAGGAAAPVAAGAVGWGKAAGKGAQTTAQSSPYGKGTDQGKGTAQAATWNAPAQAAGKGVAQTASWNAPAQAVGKAAAQTAGWNAPAQAVGKAAAQTAGWNAPASAQPAAAGASWKGNQGAQQGAAGGKGAATSAPSWGAGGGSSWDGSQGGGKGAAAQGGAAQSWGGNQAAAQGGNASWGAAAPKAGAQSWGSTQGAAPAAAQSWGATPAPAAAQSWGATPAAGKGGGDSWSSGNQGGGNQSWGGAAQAPAGGGAQSWSGGAQGGGGGGSQSWGAAQGGGQSGGGGWGQQQTGGKW